MVIPNEWNLYKLNHVQDDIFIENRFKGGETREKGWGEGIEKDEPLYKMSVKNWNGLLGNGLGFLAIIKRVLTSY